MTEWFLFHRDQIDHNAGGIEKKVNVRKAVKINKPALQKSMTSFKLTNQRPNLK